MTKRSKRKWVPAENVTLIAGKDYTARISQDGRLEIEVPALLKDRYEGRIWAYGHSSASKPADYAKKLDVFFDSAKPPTSS